VTELSNFTTPITSGLTPTGRGALSSARAARLYEHLLRLAAARREAHVASRTYVVGASRATRPTGRTPDHA